MNEENKVNKDRNKKTSKLLGAIVLGIIRWLGTIGGIAFLALVLTIFSLVQRFTREYPHLTELITEEITTLFLEEVPEGFTE